MLAQIGERTRAWVQWIGKDDGQVIEEFSTEQLQSLGWGVTVERYGVRIATGKHVMVATAWPYTQPVRETEPRLYNLSSDGAGAHFGGGALIGVQDRPMGTFPESVQNRYGGR